MADTGFSTSLIVASRNRAAGTLPAMLARLPAQAMAARGVELVLVDSASEDDTLAVMQAFCAAAPFPARALRVEARGQHLAQTAGIAVARGELIAFSDDDCYFEPDYFDVLYGAFDPRLYQYGTGAIRLWDPGDDPRVASTAWWSFEGDRKIIPPKLVFQPGIIQGGNMFFLRGVIDRLGGWQFLLDGDADATMAILASLAGFTGIMMRGLVVHHHHGGKPGSPEAIRSLENYALSRGAYSAALMSRGIAAPWAVWDRSRLRPLSSAQRLRFAQLEFEGAARYLERLAREGAEAQEG